MPKHTPAKRRQNLARKQQQAKAAQKPKPKRK